MPTMSIPALVKSGVGAVLVACAMALAIVAPANAAISLDSFTTTFHEPVAGDFFDPTPPTLTPDTAAGAHSDLTIDLMLSTTTDGQGNPVPEGELRNVQMELPAGFYGNVASFPACTRGSINDQSNYCRPETQVGMLYLHTGVDPSGDGSASIHNMTPTPGATATLGFNLFGFPTYIDMYVRGGESPHVRAVMRNVTQTLNTWGARITLWGVPANPIHDGHRFDGKTNSGGTPSHAPPTPFLSTPARCDGDLTTEVFIESWHGATDSASDDEPMRTDCELLEFDPFVGVHPTSSQPGAPSGYQVDVHVPQEDSVSAPSTPQLQSAVVTLPEGVSISPSAAEGLQACSDAQMGVGSDSEPACPEASKVGSVSVETPVLEDELTGDVVVGSPEPGQMFRLWLVVRGPGVLLKLPGDVDADPQTGRLTTSFDNTPQLPFSKLSLKLKGGPNALLANPTSCGEKTASAELSGWHDGVAVPSTDSFAIDCPGVSGFAPSLAAGAVSPTGGAFSPFAVRINRGDDDQYLSSVSLELPKGVSAKLAGVPLCSDAAVSAGACDAGSRVGTATVGAGPGFNPFYLSGGVFLTGPYKGAPYGLATIVRALAGPYDLGTVVVRQALHVDPTDGHVTVVSDQFPTILEGVPLRLRSINVDIDRPGFTLNPTSCAEKQIHGTLTSTEGASSSTSQRFQVGDCSALAFTPKLALRLTGKAQRKPGGHPGLRAVLTQPADQANLKQVKVKLPSSLALDAENAAAVCDYDQSLQANCPEASKIGDATAYTPILNRPLSGPVYLVQGIRFDPKTGNRIRTLPTLLAKLRGDVAINLRATNSVSGKKLVSTFPTIPDVPVSKFSLRLHSGTNGILAVTGTRNLCRQPRTAAVETDAQNGKRADYATRMKTPCAKKKRR